MSNRRHYFEWLLDQTRCRFVKTDDYRLLLEYLYLREFTWTIPFDSHRADNGLGLRYEFASEYGYLDEDRPCTVLEVLIALARDWEHEIVYDFHKGDRSAQWFWTMINNLGLLDYPDWSFEEDIVDEIINIWLERRFEKNGNGSPFLVKVVNRDQRRIELWLQLQDYLLENTDF